jgi:YesN/AraC family two-component response regulator
MSKKKVVIVEDSINIRNQLKKIIFSIDGIDLAAETESIENAIKLVKKHKPFALIIDIGLPDGNGMDLIKTAKKKVPNLITIVFTNYSSFVYRKRCLELGTDYFFDKTTDVDKLIDTLSNFSKI